MSEEARRLEDEVELQLGDAERYWRDLPQVEAEIHEWDVDDAEVFILSSPLEDARLRYLQEWRDEGAMTDAQLARHDGVLKLAASNRQILDRLADR